MKWLARASCNASSFTLSKRLSREMRIWKWRIAMGMLSEFGLLFLLVFAFAAPMLGAYVGRLWGHPDKDDENG
jgi:hypothetical protein